MKKEKQLVWLTLILAVILSLIVIYFNTNFVRAVAIDTSKQTSFGKMTASVQVVAFESLRCPHCKHYTETIFPNLKKQYIDTDKIKYTPIFILTADPDSAAEAAYCIQKHNPEEFFNFIDIIYKYLEEDKTWTINRILFIATKLPNINIASLHQCLDDGEFSQHISDNEALIRQTEAGVPGLKEAGVPALFVNGIYVKELTQEKLFKLIDGQLANSAEGKN